MEEPRTQEKNGADRSAKDALTWEMVSEKHLVQNEWIDFRESAYRLPDGTVFEPFYSFSRRDYVVIVATDEEGRYLCVRQFRQGIRRVTVEFPAGGIERTDGKEYRSRADEPLPDASQEALSAAKRELMEETGCVSDDWTHLLTIPSNATISDNYAYVYRAENCRKVSGQKLDDTEFLNIETHTGEEIGVLIQSGEFPQAVHVMAFLFAGRQ